jgi:hypothetical protein
MRERLFGLVALVAIAVLATGCTYGLPILGGFDDEIPVPSIVGTYSQGSASLVNTRDGATETIALDRVGPGSQLTSDFGGSASWRNSSGWVLQVSAFDMSYAAPDTFESAAGGYSGDVVLQLINGTDVWRADSFADAGNRCIVDLNSVTATVLAGTATCRGLRWVDGLAAVPLMNQVFIEGQQPFDADITFEARP